MDITSLVLLRGRFVCDVHCKRDNSVGALDSMSAIKPLTKAEKSITFLADCANIDLVFDEQRDETSPRNVRPNNLRIAFLADMFLNVVIANEW